MKECLQARHMQREDSAGKDVDDEDQRNTIEMLSVRCFRQFLTTGCD